MPIVKVTLSVDTTSEIELYNLWIYGKIKEYWELVFDRRCRNNSCGIWNLKQLSFEEFPDIDVYKLNSSS